MSAPRVMPRHDPSDRISDDIAGYSEPWAGAPIGDAIARVLERATSAFAGCGVAACGVAASDIADAGPARGASQP